MKRIKIFYINILSLILAFIVIGCAEESSSGVLELDAGEPMILESETCLTVSSSKPVGITDSFFSFDDRIYIWIHWMNVEDMRDVGVEWFEPDDEIPAWSDVQTIDSTSGYAITWFYIEKPEEGFVEGEWSVDIYLDDDFQRSHIFFIN
ncbi:hypothetical protein GF312_18085 [Candidatus Poribacteria bacterium]|nr:hypothetical protein [Candidatus Poribacteria bacterium]